MFLNTLTWPRQKRHDAQFVRKLLFEKELSVPDVSSVELWVQGQTFQFDIHSKRVQMGSVPLNQLWIDTRTLYDPRPGVGGNSMAIVDCYWALCRQGNTIGELSVRESYLLARLLPYSRQYGARRIMPDSRFGRGGEDVYHETPKGALAELEAMLATARNNSCDAETFRQKTADILGVPRLDDPTRRLYDDFCESLFELPRLLMASGDTEDAVKSLIQMWEREMKAWGRRSGMARGKQVLDVLIVIAHAPFDWQHQRPECFDQLTGYGFDYGSVCHWSHRAFPAN